MNIITPSSIPESQLNNLKCFFKEIPPCVYYQITNLLDLDKIDNQSLASSIKSYFIENLRVNEQIEDLLKDTCGFHYKFNNKLYIFHNGYDTTLFHEMTHALYSDKIKNIADSKELKLPTNRLVLLDEFIAEYFSTLATNSVERLYSCWCLCRNMKSNSDAREKYFFNIPYFLGAYMALKETNNLPPFAKFLPNELSEKSSIIYSSLIFDDNKTLLDINFEKFLTLYKKRDD